MEKKIFFSLLFLAFTGILFGQPPQDKLQLEKERQQIQKELNEIQGLYNQVKGQAKQILVQASVLNRKIDLQEKYIGNINKEIKAIDDDISLSNREIYRLQKQLDTLKMQYAKTVVYAYKNRSNYDYLNFIFSSSGFNDAIKRIAYLKSYKAYREKEVGTIVETQQLIAQRKKQQLGKKDQKNAALGNQTKQVQELAVQKKEKDAVVSQLKSKQKDLQGQIASKKKKDRDVLNAINALVRRDIETAKAKTKIEADAKKKADDLVRKNNTSTNPDNTNTTDFSPVTANTNVTRNNPTRKTESYLNLNANDVALNTRFELNRAKLPWPVDNGVVTLRFGINAIDKLTFDNPGITIATPSAGVVVKAVFDGEVSGVYNLGDAMAVTIRHGKYYTTYSNLSSVSVSILATVKTGQVLGKAGRGDDGNGGQIDFILMIETKKVDPQPWLRR